jgi:hypothetical protein
MVQITAMLEVFLEHAGPRLLFARKSDASTRPPNLPGDVDGALDILDRALSEGLLNVEWKSEQLFAGVEVPDFGCVRLPPR